MCRFVFRPEAPEPHRFAHQAGEMRDRLAEAGYGVPLSDLVQAWEAYSDSVCATWISADGLEPEEMLDRIRSYLEEVDGPSGPDL
jgi:hypothetical protein